MRIAAIMLGMLLVTRATAGDAGERAAAVDKLFREFEGQAPSASVMVIRDGRAVLMKSYGLADLERPAKATPRTSYRLASVSKQFTALAVLMLAERGKLTLNDDLTRFFPDFPAYGKEIRVRHLLTHTSGLWAYEDLIPEGTTVPVLDHDVLAMMKERDRTYFPPGTQFRYSNSGYAVLASIVEKVSGVSFAEFVTQTIFRPLGMRRTFLTSRDKPRHETWRAYGYSRREKGFERTDQSLTSYVLGDGGIYSTVEDLARWERSLLNARLLPAEKLHAAMSAQVPTDKPGRSYGYGWYVGRHGDLPAVWHEGSSIGFRNFYLRIPEKRLAVIVLTNSNEALPEALARSVADLFLEEAPAGK